MSKESKRSSASVCLLSLIAKGIIVEKVSIVMPSFNCEDTLGYSVNSVMAQTYSNWELIIVDDASTDKTYDVAREIATRDARISVLRLDVNKGPAVARNCAIRISSGRYIAFLDSDDIWYPSKLEVQIEFMKARGIYFSFASYRRRKLSGQILGVVRAPNRVTYKQLLKTCPIGCLTAVYDADALGRVEMPLIKKRQDFGLWLKLLKIVPYASGIDQVLADYIVRNDSVSSNKIHAAKYQWKIYREVEKLGLLYSTYCFIVYTCNGLLRRI